jgi:hypothetical protein
MKSQKITHIKYPNSIFYYYDSKQIRLNKLNRILNEDNEIVLDLNKIDTSNMLFEQNLEYKRLEVFYDRIIKKIESQLGTYYTETTDLINEWLNISNLDPNLKQYTSQLKPKL